MAWRPTQAQQLVSIDGKGQVTLWDVTTQSPVVIFAALQPLIAEMTPPDVKLNEQIDPVIAWSPDGKRLAVLGTYVVANNPDAFIGVSNSELQIWDVDVQQALLTVPVAGYYALAWSLDGTRLAMAGDTTMQVLDAKTGNLTFVKPLGADFLTALAWKPDNKTLTIGSYPRDALNPKSSLTNVPLSTMTFQKLTVSPVCLFDPQTLEWRVQNPNPVAVPFAWTVNGHPVGGWEVPPARGGKLGQALFPTTLASDGSNTVQLFIGSAPQAAQTATMSSLAQCKPDQVPTPRP